MRGSVRIASTSAGESHCEWMTIRLPSAEAIMLVAFQPFRDLMTVSVFCCSSATSSCCFCGSTEKTLTRVTGFWPVEVMFGVPVGLDAARGVRVVFKTRRELKTDQRTGEFLGSLARRHGRLSGLFRLPLRPAD